MSASAEKQTTRKSGVNVGYLNSIISAVRNDEKVKKTVVFVGEVGGEKKSVKLEDLSFTGSFSSAVNQIALLVASRLSAEASNLTSFAERVTVLDKELSVALLTFFPGEYGKFLDAEGNQDNWSNIKTARFTKIARNAAGRGHLFNTHSLKSYGNPRKAPKGGRSEGPKSGQKISAPLSRYLRNVISQLISDIIVASGGVTARAGKTRISPADINFALQSGDSNMVELRAGLEKLGIVLLNFSLLDSEVISLMDARVELLEKELKLLEDKGGPAGEKNALATSIKRHGAMKQKYLRVVTKSRGFYQRATILRLIKEIAAKLGDEKTRVSDDFATLVRLFVEYKLFQHAKSAAWAATAAKRVTVGLSDLFSLTKELPADYQQTASMTVKQVQTKNIIKIAGAERVSSPAADRFALYADYLITRLVQHGINYYAFGAKTLNFDAALTFINQHGYYPAVAVYSKKAGNDGRITTSKFSRRSGKRKAGEEEAPVKKVPAKKAPVKKAPVKKAPVKKAPAKKAPAKRGGKKTGKK